MLVIAANQTLLRYGIDLEKTGPEGDSNGNPSSNSNATLATTTSAGDDKIHREDNEDGIDSGTERSDTISNVPVQSVRAVDNEQGKHPQPSSVDDAAIAKAESAALQKELRQLKKDLKKKPKEVIVEKDMNVRLEAPKSILNLEKKLNKRLGKDDR
jgi:hypothetical protein